VSVDVVAVAWVSCLLGVVIGRWIGVRDGRARGRIEAEFDAAMRRRR